MALSEGKPLGGAVEFVIDSPVCGKEVEGIPEVESEVVERAGGIPQELRAAEMGIALKEPDPATLGAHRLFQSVLHFPA